MWRMRLCLFLTVAHFFFGASVVFLRPLHDPPPFDLERGRVTVSPPAVGVPPCRTPVDSLECHPADLSSP